VLADEPDLTREPDTAGTATAGAMAEIERLRRIIRQLAAERDDLLARIRSIECIVTEWGMRHDDCLTDVHDYGRDEKAARQSVTDHARLNGRLVRRTVTYSQWEEVPGD
jgi:hypothetical protein